ncbi:hypothetical protein FQN51_003152 [Onygenales sp. PD_10]|nr:hypothetical protein FQN51_003152 [Onygenales sp. PD_10]
MDASCPTTPGCKYAHGIPSDTALWKPHGEFHSSATGDQSINPSYASTTVAEKCMPVSDSEEHAGLGLPNPENPWALDRDRRQGTKCTLGPQLNNIIPEFVDDVAICPGGLERSCVM